MHQQRIVVLNPVTFIGRLKQSSFARLVAAIAFPLMISGCQLNSTPQTSRDYLEVTPTQLSKYWVIQDNTLNWQDLLNYQSNQQQLNIRFSINQSGQLVDLDIDHEQLAMTAQQKELLLARFSEQRFNATVDNKTAQPVRVSATVVFN